MIEKEKYIFNDLVRNYKILFQSLNLFRSIVEIQNQGREYPHVLKKLKLID